MSDTMTGLKRSHMCNEINETMIDQIVTVMGWVHRKRSMSQMNFLVMRDRTGNVQLVVDEGKIPDVYEKTKNIRSEFVIAVKGRVIARAEKDINPEMATGKVEIEADELRILSEAEVPPFQIAETGVKEDLRLKYRYLDLRRPEVQQNIIARHKISTAIREFLNGEGFVDIETPYLTKSTPEGARDYLVPSRVHPGNFYALPQSPQLLKQILMISGFDKYYQIVRCFRDEDLRADRQPEFTQVDMELSFIDMEDVIDVNERLMQHIMKEVLDVDIELPLPRMKYEEAMERYGSDKPDVRFGMELVNISDLVKETDFGVFKGALENGGSVRGINARGCGSLTRKQIDAFVEVAKTYRAKGLVWIAISETGELKTTISKFFSESELKKIVEAFDGRNNDLILISADKDSIVFDTLGNLRLEVAKKLELVQKDDYRFLWVTEFPLFEWDEESNRYFAKHHPFTSPMDDDLPLFDTNPGAMRAKAYDLVLNGYELGGGSIRIFQNEVQEKMFKTLGFSQEEAYAQFQYLLDAFKYGVPPHGGLALGLDRICMLLTGSTAIRDVIAFPKVKDASCPLTNAPSQVDVKQLKELGLEIMKISPQE